MPQLDREQQKTVRAIRREARTIRDPKLRRTFTRAAVQVGLVEDNLHNSASERDHDSQNWRQERRSIYGDEWARTGGSLNLRASVRRFKNEFLQHYDPGEKSYDVAAQVQRPAAQYRGRYREMADEAKAILGQYGGRVTGTSNTPGGTSDSSYTVPGVDNSDARRSLMLDYLDERGKPGALLGLKAGLDAAQDVPEQTVRYSASKGTRTNLNNDGRNSRKRSNLAAQDLKELFYNGPGGVNVDEGRRVGKGFVDGHTDHVHAAFATSKAAVRAGKLAQQMGLSVREHPHFDKVDPVHTQGSFHYSNQAIDVSGDPALMRKFAKRLARMYGV